MLNLKLDAVKGIVNADAIENGAWLHLRSPHVRDGEEEGDLLYLDPEDKRRPIRALVRSYRSQHFRAQDFKVQTKALGQARRMKGAKQQDAIMEEAAWLERPRRFAALLVSLDNVSKESPGVQTPSEEDKIELASKSSEEAGNYQWLVDQVMKFGFDDDNFGGAPAGEEKAGGGKGEPESPPA